eukprot:Sspe_Gene.49046::Locus_26035_Transcript_1_1_Confidence_1.000_Length_1049::g.49046::m.49046
MRQPKVQLCPVEEIQTFFNNKLMLRDFRPQGPCFDDASAAAVRAEFHQRVLVAKKAADNGMPLDAFEWAVWCCDFTDRNKTYCTWLSPMRLRDFMTRVMGSTWCNLAKLAEHPELEDIPDEFTKKISKEKPRAQPCMCSVCGIKCNSIDQYKTHVNGSKHSQQVFKLKQANPAFVEPEGPIYQNPPVSDSNSDSGSRSDGSGNSVDDLCEVTSSPSVQTMSGSYYRYNPYSFTENIVVVVA